MISVSGRVLNREEVLARIRTKGDAVRDRVAKALRLIGAEVVALAQAKAPVLKKPRADRVAGALRDSIKATVTGVGKTWYGDAGGQDGGLRLRVAPREWYARFPERGVVDHATNHNKSLKGGKRAKGFRLGMLRSAGQWRIPPRPYMQPAFDAVSGRIESAIADAINAAVAEET